MNKELRIELEKELKEYNDALNDIEKDIQKSKDKIALYTLWKSYMHATTPSPSTIECSIKTNFSDPNYIEKLIEQEVGFKNYLSDLYEKVFVGYQNIKTALEEE